MTALKDLPLSEVTSRDDASMRLAASIPDLTTRQFLLTNLVEVNGSYEWRINLDAIAKHYEEVRNHIPKDLAPDDVIFTGKTLFVRGGKSDYILSHHLPIMEARFPNCSITTIAESGHWPHYEQPKRFLEALRPFLSS